MFEWLEEDFVQMQGKFWLFFFEAIVTLYLMLSQGVIADKFLMKSLENITHRYSLSQSIAGILIAFGVAVPEVVVTILSFQKHGIKMKSVVAVQRRLLELTYILFKTQTAYDKDYEKKVAHQKDNALHRLALGCL